MKNYQQHQLFKPVVWISIRPQQNFSINLRSLDSNPAAESLVDLTFQETMISC